MTAAPGNSAYHSPAECVRAARAGVSKVAGLLSEPTPQNAELCAELMRNVAEQLGSAAQYLHTDEYKRDAALRSSIEMLQREVKVLAGRFAATDRLLSGWVRTVGAKSGGYTEEGGSAPLVLIKKVDVTG